MANVIKLWKGAVEPASSSPSGNEIKAWKGAVEPAVPAASAGDGSFTGNAQRFAMHLMAYPDSVVDVQERHAIAAIVQPDPDANTSLNKRAGVMGLDSIVYPDGVIRQNDRMIMAGYFPVIDEDQAFIERFDISWNIAPTWSRVASDTDGQVKVEAGLFTFAGAGATSQPPTDGPLITWGAYVTMQPTDIAFATNIAGTLSGDVRFIDFVAAKTWIQDLLGMRVTVTTYDTPRVVGQVQVRDFMEGRTTIRNYIAATVRTPSVDK